MRQTGARQKRPGQATPAPENLSFWNASWNGAGWLTPLISPEAKRPTQRMATQIMGESGLTNPKLARLDVEKASPAAALHWGLGEIAFANSSSRAHGETSMSRKKSPGPAGSGA
jgi:hypothetical protein